MVCNGSTINICEQPKSLTRFHLMGLPDREGLRLYSREFDVIEVLYVVEF